MFLFSHFQIHLRWGIKMRLTIVDDRSKVEPFKSG